MTHSEEEVATNLEVEASEMTSVEAEAVMNPEEEASVKVVAAMNQEVEDSAVSKVEAEENSQEEVSRVKPEEAMAEAALKDIDPHLKIAKKLTKLTEAILPEMITRMSQTEAILVLQAEAEVLVEVPEVVTQVAPMLQVMKTPQTQKARVSPLKVPLPTTLTMIES
jgi:hypothetical protein